MPADIPGIQRLVASGSTSAVEAGTAAPTTSSIGLVTRLVNNRPAAVTVRASTDYNTSTSSTNTSDVVSYGGVIGMYLSIDQTAIAASSAGGGTGVMTHTVQVKDSIGATYTGSTVSIALTTGVGTWIFACYPGNATLAPTSGAPGKSDFLIPNVWRVQSSASSSATNYTYSIAATYVPTAASSS